MAIKNIVSVYNIASDKISVGEFPEIEGQANTGVSVGLVSSSESTGRSILMTTIEPNGYLAYHKGEAEVDIIVTSGNGTVSLADADGIKKNEFKISAGDVIVFKGDQMALHDFRAGNDGLTYIVISN